MSNADEPTPEDIAGLFRKFGGDAHGYREFAPPEAEGEAPRAWALLSGEKISHPPVQAALPAAPVPAPAPAPVAPAPVAPPAWAPAPLLAPVAAPAPLFAAPPARIEPVLAPLHAPQPLSAPPARTAAAPSAALAAAPGAANTPLQQLFERLVSPQPPAAPPGPMSRWRRPT